ncbi:MAG: tRNA uridine 5-carboxymethylaminomethyl modification enzyme [Candidatus Omnitrophota bacterium]|jgi:tRNA uridine 5-carboxymethylaminomethyl modification enzyme
MIELGTYDIIVIGAGHAGCEAALASARMGSKTLMLTMNLDSIAQMSCNPAIGGLAKGHIVREIDALGGEMGKVTDKTGIQFRMLNLSKGPAVWAPRAQSDKKAYQWTMKHVLEAQPNLELSMAEVKEVLTKDNRITGVVTSIGTIYYTKAIIITTGTFLNGLIHIGDVSFGGGRAGDRASTGLTGFLLNCGLKVLRLKTGTPCRLNGRSIDYSKMEIQPGDTNPQPFSHWTKELPQNQMACHMTYTNSKTHDIIKANIHKSPLYSGKIKSKGPRYCPSIEDKVTRFSDRPKHQLFIEPEGRDTLETYINGISTSLPQDVQYAMIRSVVGLENAEFLRFGYAVEYDFVQPTQLKSTLEVKAMPGLYLAGQINGTSGYEEAACQGLMAGINAVLKINGQKPFILGRDEAYIGVLIDDLVTKGTSEPYRMFTSRAEHRLLLRQDNADLRLTDYGYELGLVSAPEYQEFNDSRNMVNKAKEVSSKIKVGDIRLSHYIKMPDVSLEDVVKLLAPEGIGAKEAKKAAIEMKYQGYIDRELKAIKRSKHLESKKIPESIDYQKLKHLSNEARDKFSNIRPVTVGQAARISGIRPVDVSVLTVYIEKSRLQQQ